MKPRKGLLLRQSQTWAGHILGGTWQQPEEPRLGRRDALKVTELNRGSSVLPEAAVSFVAFSSGF